MKECWLMSLLRKHHQQYLVKKEITGITGANFNLFIPEYSWVLEHFGYQDTRLKIPYK